MFFRRPPLHSIDTSREMINHAMHIAYGYKHNKQYMPTEDEIEKFELFEKELWKHYCTARYILRSMNQRLYGKPEKTGNWPKTESAPDPNTDKTDENPEE
ncbi:MAG: hypothetical protein SFX19_09710 [Alphaproteobacteria bacterium]|nr:hypothetical protein [Alphaproteobacteria bacterium]